MSTTGPALSALDLPGAPSDARSLMNAGFLPLNLASLSRAEVPGYGLGTNWDTLSSVPDSAGLLPLHGRGRQRGTGRLRRAHEPPLDRQPRVPGQATAAGAVSATGGPSDAGTVTSK